MNKEQRIEMHQAQRRIQVKSGVPSVSDLSEGVPVIRSTSDGLYQYVRYNGVLHKVKLERV